MEPMIHQRVVDDRVLIFAIDNPPLNALSGRMLALMADALRAVQSNDAIRSIVLTGRGRAFCSGVDLKEVAAGGRTLGAFADVLELVAASRAPVVAAINGHCIGGGFELALCCDLRIASTAATFVCAGVNVGLMASTYRLPRLIGTARAKAMLLTGSPHDALTAERWGLVTAVHPPEQLDAAALALATRIATRAPLSVEASKRVADRAVDLSPEEADAMVAREMPILARSNDHKEALAAFIEKREAQFRRN
jgi:enoyl-CoA hydratase